jgi:DegV family protein with EDD domain
MVECVNFDKEETIMSQNYVLMTDVGSDLPASYYKEHNIPFVSLTVTMDGKSFKDDAGQTVPYSEFYAKVRGGSMPTTAMVNMGEYTDVFEPILQEGKDIIYIALSSGLSGSYANAAMTAGEMKEKYPDRKIITIDSLCASLGQGLLVHEARKRRDEGYDLEKLHAWIDGNKMDVNHMLFVEDLMHLCRGGRVSRASAVIGSLIGIKPELIMNTEGKLQVIGKHRGRQGAMKNLIERMTPQVASENLGDIMICHSDCQLDAEAVRDMIGKKYKFDSCLINYIGCTIGAHTGAGIISIFFFGKTRTPVE